MSLLNAVTRFTLGALTLKLGTLLVNALSFPRLRASTPQVDLCRVSILVPARNESQNLPITLPSLLAQEAEVTVLDDGSQDDTAELARRLGARVIAGEGLPTGWLGKPWACQQLAAQASGDILIFTDADVLWQPGALQALLHEFQRSRADLLSLWPRQHNITPGERLLTPLIDDVLLSLFPYPLIHLPFSSASAANGQVMVFRRGPYQESGGHGLVQRELLEDVQFARRFKAAGKRVALALGGEFVGVRMYRSYPQAVRGFSKNTLPLHGGSRPVMWLSWGLHFALYTLPWLRGQRPLMLVGVLEALLVRRLTGRTKPADLLEILALPLLPLLSLPVYWRASRRQVEWKGREYQQD